MTLRPEDEGHLREALALASEAAGLASPNPTVGAVVVRQGRVVGRGAHVHDDRAHAEVVALRQAARDARGATLFVTLEPCSTSGRTPPCTNAIVESGVSRVVACTADPFPGHQGKAFHALRAAGLEVDVGGLREEAVRLNAPFLTSIVMGRPHVTLKAAVSVDGRIAAASGESQWLTSEAARERAHGLRRGADAVLVGIGTVLADDPRLTARPGARAERPLRCVLDPSLRIVPGARLLAEAEQGEGAGPVLVFVAPGAGARDADRAAALRSRGAALVELARDASGFDLRALLADLAARGVRSLLVEGGGRTTGSFLAVGLADRIVLHVAPLVLGGAGTPGAFEGFGARTLSEAVRLRRLQATSVGPDVLLDAEVVGGFDPAALSARLAEMER